MGKIKIYDLCKSFGEVEIVGLFGKPNRNLDQKYYINVVE